MIVSELLAAQWDSQVTNPGEGWELWTEGSPDPASGRPLLHHSHTLLREDFICEVLRLQI